MMLLAAPEEVGLPGFCRAVRGKFRRNAGESCGARLQSTMGAASDVCSLCVEPTILGEHGWQREATKKQSLRVLPARRCNRKTFPGQPCGFCGRRYQCEHRRK